MNLYLLEQHENNDYDTFDSLVVAAESEEQARSIGPNPHYWTELDAECRFNSWASHKAAIKVTLIGVAKDGTGAGLILSSFNAG